jgi:hypothetical protein
VPFAVRRPAHRPRHALASTRSRGRCHVRARPPERRNTIRYTFFQPAARELFADWNHSTGKLPRDLDRGGSAATEEHGEQDQNEGGDRKDAVDDDDRTREVPFRRNDNYPAWR